MRRYRGNVVVQEQAAKMLRSLAEMRQSIFKNEKFVYRDFIVKSGAIFLQRCLLSLS
jgi:hypothetical protein